MENQVENSAEQPEMSNEEVVQPAAEESTTVEVNHEKLDQYMARLRMEQNLPMAIAAGVITCLVSAVLWAVISVSTGYQIGYMAVGVGLLVGYSVRFLGKGMDQVFGIIGAVFALLGCLLGNAFAIVGFLANEGGMGVMNALEFVNVSFIVMAMKETFSPMDLLFYGIAIYEGYKFAFRQITEEEILQHAT